MSWPSSEKRAETLPPEHDGGAYRYMCVDMYQLHTYVRARTLPTSSVGPMSKMHKMEFQALLVDVTLTGGSDLSVVVDGVTRRRFRATSLQIQRALDGGALPLPLGRTQFQGTASRPRRRWRAYVLWKRLLADPSHQVLLEIDAHALPSRGDPRRLLIRSSANPPGGWFGVSSAAWGRLVAGGCPLGFLLLRFRCRFFYFQRGSQSGGSPFPRPLLLLGLHALRGLLLLLGRLLLLHSWFLIT